jgi:hypothetical protein
MDKYKKFEVVIPKKMSFTELHIYTIEAESEEEALALAKQDLGEVEYDNRGDYQVDYEYEDDIEVKQLTTEAV